MSEEIIIAMAIIDYIIFYIIFNIKNEELQVLLAGLGLSMITATLHMCNLLAVEESYTAVSRIFINLTTITSLLSVAIFTVFVFMFMVKAFKIIPEMVKKIRT